MSGLSSNAGFLSDARGCLTGEPMVGAWSGRFPNPTCLALACLGLVLPATASSAARAPVKRFVVVYSTGASLQSAHAALNRLGARIVRENRTVGVATVVTRTRNFASRAARTWGAARCGP